MGPIGTAVRRRLRVRPEECDRGISLVELIVSVMIFGIVLTIVVGMYSGMSRTVALAGAVGNSVKFASLGMNEISRILRFATTNPVLGQPIDDPAFVVAKAETLTVYTYIDTSPTSPQPIKVTFALDGSRRLTEARYSAYALSTGYWAFQSTPYSTMVLTGTVMPPATGELTLFSYLAIDGTTITIPTGGIAASAFPTIAAVQVTLKIKGDTKSGSNPLILSNTVGLPNLGLNRTGQ